MKISKTSVVSLKKQSRIENDRKKGLETMVVQQENKKLEQKTRSRRKKWCKKLSKNFFSKKGFKKAVSRWFKKGKKHLDLN